VDIYYIYIYYLLHREQLHVSALDNGHLQVVYETLSKQLYKHVYGLLIWGREGVKWARDLVSVLKVRWCGLHGGVHAVTKLCLSLL
jgi:hypothetical protein